MFKPSKVLILLVVGLLLSACQSADTSSDLTVPSQQSADRFAPSKTWDYTSWEPTIKIVRKKMTEEEKLQWRTDWLNRNKNIEGVDPSQLNDPGLVRFEPTLRDADLSVAQCLNDRGFKAHPHPTGGIQFDPHPQSQEPALLTADWECNAMYTPEPALLTDWSEDQLSLLYDYWDQYFIPCLADHNINVDTSHKPSKQTWVSLFHTPDSISWQPDDYLVFVDRYPGGEQVQKDCPGMPPTDVFYGAEE
ncbi:hypothetical protein [Arcanobacterium phocae]|uniref:hypothetical protein n=1 Tax=Arcanobacterium phocae TaxID=131112 RepID=UPI001C0F1CC6|nr:hypothetical protein [Arcanobacterium phocae]